MDHRGCQVECFLHKSLNIGNEVTLASIRSKQVSLHTSIYTRLSFTCSLAILMLDTFSTSVLVYIVFLCYLLNILRRAFEAKQRLTNGSAKLNQAVLDRNRAYANHSHLSCTQSFHPAVAAIPDLNVPLNSRFNNDQSSLIPVISLAF